MVLINSYFVKSNKQVTIVARKPLSVRQFDLAVEWMGMKRANYLAGFWTKSGSRGQEAAGEEGEGGGGGKGGAAIAAGEEGAEAGDKEGGKQNVCVEDETDLTDLEARAAVLRRSKNGGSVTPEVLAGIRAGQKASHHTLV
jgi:hypothetical protein